MFTKKLQKYSTLSLGLLVGAASTIHAGGFKKYGHHNSGKDLRSDKQLNAALRRQKERESNAQTTVSNTEFEIIQRAGTRQPINVQLAPPQLQALCLLATLGVVSNLVLPACALLPEFNDDLATTINKREQACHFWSSSKDHDSEYITCLAQTFNEVKEILKNASSARIQNELYDVVFHPEKFQLALDRLKSIHEKALGEKKAEKLIA